MTGTEEIALELKKIITTDQAWHYRIVPRLVDAESIEFLVDEKTNTESTQQELEILIGKKIILTAIASAELNKILSQNYRKNNVDRGEVKQKTAQIGGTTDEFIPNLIQEAKELGSSDIHIEIYEEKCRIRFRIDGLLVERYQIGKTNFPALVNIVKIKANLDIAEKRLPQDGRIIFNRNGYKFDIRVSVLPTLHGEKIVLRILSNDATHIDINKLGFSATQLKHYLEGIKKPHGILLISGPTGSGKTTSLYATLKLLNKNTTNILTIEDPIEYTLEGINQVQLKESIGLTFASALRTFLRQDPDVIMLGEIRDGETAQMAIRASLTGHLVLSTIHTNSALGTIARLIDMGIEPFLIASTLNTSVAQRLLRVLCPYCKCEQAFDHSLLPKSFIANKKITSHFTPVGCDQCHFTGYKGRKAVYEVIPVDAELARHIKSNNLALKKEMEERGITSLSENAFNLFTNGETSFDEIFPVLLSEN
jgi:type IV pilus assembly protein PilB